jgi:protease I
MAGQKGLAVVLAEDHYEDLELQYPRLRLEEAGYEVRVAGPEKGKTYTSKYGYPVTTDAAFNEINPSQVKVLICPGGYAPDRLRRYEDCLKLVSNAWQGGCVVGAICHGGWVPISAGIVNNVRMTSVGAIKDDLVNAGAEWVDERNVADGNYISAQTPPDLPVFMQQILEAADKS